MKIDRLSPKYWCFQQSLVYFSISCCGPTPGLRNAITCGEDALKLDPDSFHACNMLGATYFQLSDFETGYAYFQQALEKGAALASQNKSLQTQIQGFEVDYKIKVAQFLLQQDPTRYSWAKKYLHHYLSS